MSTSRPSLRLRLRPQRRPKMGFAYEVYHAVRKPKPGGLERAIRMMAESITVTVHRSPPAVRRFPVGERTIHEYTPEKNPVRFHPDSCGKGDKVPRRPRLDELD